ncbi:MAG: DUF3575 domain-containing protein [Bacteroidales bacterium]|nr:DUF3575 domain-containing protein [Bacteroidales bacterium]
MAHAYGERGSMSAPAERGPEVREHRMQGDVFAAGLFAGWSWWLSEQLSLEAEVGIGARYPGLPAPASGRMERRCRTACAWASGAPPRSSIPSVHAGAHFAQGGRGLVRIFRTGRIPAETQFPGKRAEPGQRSDAG